MSLFKASKVQAFAIVRYDEDVEEVDEQFSVIKVVMNEEVAESEVNRLNSINSDKKCQYHYQITRLYD